jgi:SepF-like predicted cell division protein (DUF552 family)
VDERNSVRGKRIPSSLGRDMRVIQMVGESTTQAFDDDVVNGNLSAGNKLIVDIKNLRKRKRAAEKDRDELEREFKQLGGQNTVST